ncbi:hypothetical protein MRX96_047075 [Rhipicephalus microplus]
MGACQRECDVGAGKLARTNFRDIAAPPLFLDTSIEQGERHPIETLRRSPSRFCPSSAVQFLNFESRKHSVRPDWIEFERKHVCKQGGANGEGGGLADACRNLLS